MISVHSERPICASPHLSEVSATLPLKQFHCLSDSQWPFLVLSCKIIEHFLFLRLSPPGDRWGGGFSFVPAGSVSSSSTLQGFWNTSYLWWLLFPLACLLRHFPSLWHVQGKTSTGAFEHGCWTLTRVSNSTFHLFIGSSLNLWGYGMCGLTVTSWGNPVEGACDRFHLHCQAGS